MEKNGQPRIPIRAAIDKKNKKSYLKFKLNFSKNKGSASRLLFTLLNIYHIFIDELFATKNILLNKFYLV